MVERRADRLVDQWLLSAAFDEDRFANSQWKKKNKTFCMENSFMYATTTKPQTMKEKSSNKRKLNFSHYKIVGRKTAEVCGLHPRQQ